MCNNAEPLPPEMRAGVLCVLCQKLPGCWNYRMILMCLIRFSHGGSSLCLLRRRCMKPAQIFNKNLVEYLSCEKSGLGEIGCHYFERIARIDTSIYEKELLCGKIIQQT
jgi:hypothetical protein